MIETLMPCTVRRVDQRCFYRSNQERYWAQTPSEQVAESRGVLDLHHVADCSCEAVVDLRADHPRNGLESAVVQAIDMARGESNDVYKQIWSLLESALAAPCSETPRVQEMKG